MAGRSKSKGLPKPSAPRSPMDPSIFDEGLDGYLKFTNEILWQAYEREINPNHAGALIRGAKVAAEIWTAKQLLDGAGGAGAQGRVLPPPLQLWGPDEDEEDEDGAGEPGGEASASKSASPTFDLRPPVDGE